MKKLLFTSFLGLFALTSMAQEIGGCTSYFADNYSSVATFNDGSCDYDLQQLLMDGVGLADLLFSGVSSAELVGLFAEGGVVIDIDLAKQRALIAAAFSQSIYYDYQCPCCSYETATGSLLAQELESNYFPSQLYQGENNWSTIRRSYGAKNGYYSSTGGGAYSYPFASFFWGRINQLSGYGDWFVPNSTEFKAYLDLYYAQGAKSVSWPLDSNGEFTESRTLPIYDFGASDANYLLSEVLNSGAQSEVVEGSIQYIYPQFLAATYNDGSAKWDTPLGNNWHAGPHIGNNYSDDGCLTVLPMRIASLTFETSPTICSHWDYESITNQAIEAGVSCNYPLFQCDSANSVIWDELAIGIYPTNTSVIEYGRSDARDILFNVPSTHDIDGNIYDVLNFEVTNVSNIPQGLIVNLEENDLVEGGDVFCLDFEGYSTLQGVYDVEVQGSLFLDVLGSTLSTDITLTHRIAITGNVNGVQGCIYPTADNYNPLVTEDDGTCLFGGACPGDFDGDGLIGIMDILHLLGIYDTSCE